MCNPREIVTDGSSEFVSKEIKSWYRTNGIRTELSAPYTPEENGKTERSWLTVVGMARCKIHDAGLSKEYWTYALNYAFHLKNLCLYSAISKTPYDEMYKRKTNVSFLKWLVPKSTHSLKSNSTRSSTVQLVKEFFSDSVTIAKPLLLALIKEIVYSGPSKQGVPSLTRKYTLQTKHGTKAK